ncbi:MAG: hypothetical protein RR478_00885 [Bacilli bacterium]
MPYKITVGERMTREQVREMLGVNATEEDVTNFLNKFQKIRENESIKISTLETQLQGFKAKENEYTETRKEIERINKEKMTTEEKIKAEQEETSKKLSEANKILNSVKAKSILVSAGIDGDDIDDIVDTLVSEDESLTITKATKIANKFKTKIEETVKATELKLSTLDTKPNMPNGNPNDKGIISKVEFDKLPTQEQIAFKNNNIDKYHEWYPLKK